MVIEDAIEFRKGICLDAFKRVSFFISKYDSECEVDGLIISILAGVLDGMTSEFNKLIRAVKESKLNYISAEATSSLTIKVLRELVIAVEKSKSFMGEISKDSH